MDGKDFYDKRVDEWAVILDEPPAFTPTSNETI